MKQQLQEFQHVVSLPKKRSRVNEDNPYWEKKLSDSQKILLGIHDESNWTKVELIQGYRTAKKETKAILWKLPSTKEKKASCGQFRTLGCFNLQGHPSNQAYIQHTKLSCFRSSCEYCWLEKWLARESRRSTLRIEKYETVMKQLGKTRYNKPIHVIVSPSWNDKFMRFDLLKKKCRLLADQAGIKGGLMIYHPFALDKKRMVWVTRPHFHIIGFGWVHDTKKISEDDGWVIKNKGVRQSLHSTVYYLLSHAGVSDNIHSITWFGELGYRSKYAELIRVENEEPNDNCPFCDEVLFNAVFVGTDRPPDKEFVGLVDSSDWLPTERIDESKRSYRIQDEKIIY